MSVAKNIALAVAPPLRRLVEQRDALVAEKRALKGENRALISQNRSLRESAAAREPRRDLGYLFIVTYGRSGSTLLQGLLNAIPGFLIRGENAGTLEFFDAHRAAIQARLDDPRLMSAAGEVTSPWFGLDGYDTDLAAAAYRRYLLEVLLRPAADTTVVGFKEIRWFKPSDLGAFLDFVRQVFPGARFVFNTRGVDDVLRSKWWADRDPDEARAQLAGWEDRMAAAREHLGDAAYALHYDDYVNDHDSLEPFYRWLGVPFDREAVEQVFARKHSY